MEKEPPYQLPLGGPETDEEIGEEAKRAVAEEKEIKREEELIAEAKKEYGFVSAEDRRKSAKKSREDWLALRKTLFKEKEE
ncbi:MAG: hypothetical protein NUV61_00860 [Candidatus Azambacteria bacterium]|nr:hypothetical protein [Candidatus Azambacteria bacterium]